MQQRLFPTVQQLYPGKKMYLVLDNAKYHHHRGPDWFSPSSKTKGQLADFLRQRSVQSITVDHGRVIFANKFSADARGKAGGPTLAQLKTAAKQHLAEHPEINTTVPQQLMEDQNYELLYTPPYVSDLQPIEMLWAFTKAIVARQSHRTRTAPAQCRRERQWSKSPQSCARSRSRTVTNGSTRSCSRRRAAASSSSVPCRCSNRWQRPCNSVTMPLLPPLPMLKMRKRRKGKLAGRINLSQPLS
jgi:transposase